MSDLAALLHKEFITYEDEDGVPEPCSLCEARAARLEAAGVRVDRACECGHPDICTPRSEDAAPHPDGGGDGLSRLFAVHEPTGREGEEFCSTCGGTWPCETVVLLTAYVTNGRVDFTRSAPPSLGMGAADMAETLAAWRDHRAPPSEDAAPLREALDRWALAYDAITMLPSDVEDSTDAIDAWDVASDALRAAIATPAPEEADR